MGAFDFQLGVKDESTYGTAVVVDRFFEYNGSPVPVRPVAGRTEGNPLRVGSRMRRQARVIPFTSHAEGTIELDVMSDGFGFWLKHMLPSVATTGVGPYVHTATEGGTSLSIGKSFTAQFNAPLHSAGTNQPITFAGGKVTKWGLACDVDGMLVLSLDTWFNSFSTATSLATASYPTGLTNYAWSHGVVQVGGAAIDLHSFSVEYDQGYNVDRRQIRGSAVAKEPTPGQSSLVFSCEADFDSLTQFNRVHSQTVGGMSAQIVGTWTNGADVITITVPGARFDEFSFDGEAGGITQGLSGVGEYDGTNSPVTIAYTTSEATP